MFTFISTLLTLSLLWNICLAAFDSNTGTCQFCDSSGGRDPTCSDASASWSPLGDSIVSYCSLSCTWSNTVYASTGPCDCTSFSCNVVTPSPVTTTSMSPEDCVAANCEANARICTETAEYSSVCELECYGLTQSDVVSCPTSTPTASPTPCSCDTTSAPRCCTDDGDHFGTYLNLCEAQCAGCVNSYAGTCNDTTTPPPNTTYITPAPSANNEACNCSAHIDPVCCKDEGNLYDMLFNNTCFAECLGCTATGVCSPDLTTTTPAACVCDDDYTPVCCTADANHREVELNYTNACNAECDGCTAYTLGLCGATTASPTPAPTDQEGQVGGTTTTDACSCDDGVSTTDDLRVCCEDNGEIYACVKLAECRGCVSWTRDFEEDQCTASSAKRYDWTHWKIILSVVGLAVYL